MDGPGHYAEAERLLNEAVTSTPRPYGEQDAIPTLLAALAHAALASAAAAALAGTGTEDRVWAEVAAARFSPGGTDEPG